MNCILCQKEMIRSFTGIKYLECTLSNHFFIFEDDNNYSIILPEQIVNWSAVYIAEINQLKIGYTKKYSPAPFLSLMSKAYEYFDVIIEFPKNNSPKYALSLLNRVIEAKSFL